MELCSTVFRQPAMDDMQKKHQLHHALALVPKLFGPASPTVDAFQGRMPKARRLPAPCVTHTALFTCQRVVVDGRGEGPRGEANGKYPRPTADGCERNFDSPKGGIWAADWACHLKTAPFSLFFWRYVVLIV